MGALVVSDLAEQVGQARPQLATATDDAFARWDRAHLHMFDLGGVAGLLIDRYWDDPAQQLPRR